MTEDRAEKIVRAIKIFVNESIRNALDESGDSSAGMGAYYAEQDLLKTLCGELE